MEKEVVLIKNQDVQFLRKKKVEYSLSNVTETAVACSSVVNCIFR